MGIGKLVRMNRLFADPSGRLCSVAVDHFIGYNEGLPANLRHMRQTLAAIVAGRPDAVTLRVGFAVSLWAPYAGRVPMILQSTLIRADDSLARQTVTVEDALRLGADAIAVVAHVRGPHEIDNLRSVAEYVRRAARYDLPVICHIYPLDLSGERPRVSLAPEDIAWAAHCAGELGVDVVKVPYCGDVQAYAEIVASCPVPLVAAGGPKAETLEAALALMVEVVQAGARGATIGRNIWGFAGITAAVRAFKAVIHDGVAPAEALRLAGV